MEYLIVTDCEGRYFMRYFYYALIAVAVLLLITGLVCLVLCLRRRRAACKVKKLSCCQKKEKLNSALAPFGFCYDERNDAICSAMYPWQRKMGYCQTYDKAAFAMNMVMDCEPIYFDYNSQRYLLELWKGQYGCTTGAEIGLYVNRTAHPDKDPASLFYECVGDEERIRMKFVLYRNGEKILEREDVHWWLTGFCVGMTAVPEELTMQVNLTFPNAGMFRAFWNGLRKTGYEERDICVKNCRTVFFYFDEPHQPNPGICGKRCRRRVTRKNRKNAGRYCRVTRKFTTTLDKILYIGFCFPLLFRFIVKTGSKSTGRKLRRCRRQHERTFR